MATINIDTSRLPDADFRNFTVRAPRADTSTAQLITNLVDTGIQGAGAVARRDAREQTAQTVDDFLGGREASEQLDQANNELRQAQQFFEIRPDDPDKLALAEGVPEFKRLEERIKNLREAAENGETTVDEIRVNVERDMRNMIRENPLFAAEIEDGVNTAMGRYSNELRVIDEEDSARTRDSDWVYRQKLSDMNKLGFDIWAYENGTPGFRAEQDTLYARIKANSLNHTVQSQVLDSMNFDLETRKAGQTELYKSALSDETLNLRSVVSQQLGALGFGNVLNDPVALDRFHRNPESQQVQTMMVQQLDEYLASSAAQVATKFADLPSDQRNAYNAAIAAQVETYKKAITGEYSLDQMKAITDMRVNAVTNQLMDQDPKVERAIALAIKLGKDLNGDVLSRLTRWMVNGNGGWRIGEASNVPDQAGNPVNTETVVDVSTSSLASGQVTDPEDMDFHIQNITRETKNFKLVGAGIGNPDHAWFTAKAFATDRGRMAMEKLPAEVQREIREDFAAGRRGLLLQSSRAIRAQYPDIQDWIQFSASENEPGVIRIEVQPGIKGEAFARADAIRQTLVREYFDRYTWLTGAYANINGTTDVEAHRAILSDLQDAWPKAKITE